MFKHVYIIKKIEKDTIPKKFLKKTYTSISPTHYETVIDGMELALTHEDGTAILSKVEGLDICGKTGTAQNPHGEDHSIFIAFAPKDNPKIAIAVYVENGGSNDVAWDFQYLNDHLANAFKEHITPRVGYYMAKAISESKGV